MKEFIRVSKSNIEGIGVLATKPIKTGEKICRLKGRISLYNDQEKKYLNGDNRVTCCNFQIGINLYINLEKKYESINHSCNPNSAVMKSRTLVAIRPIKEGEEITYDYSSVEWTPQNYVFYNSNQWPMTCNCKSKKCRKLIVCFPYLPPSVKKKYVSGGFIQDFILKKMKWPKEKQKCYVCERKLHEFRYK